MNSYKQEKQAYDERIKLLDNIKILDRGPGKGIPVKVAAVYMLEYNDNFMGYHIKNCLALGPFEANFDEYYVINSQNGDYKIYLLDKELDQKHKIIIVQRGTTVRIFKNLGIKLTFNYGFDPVASRNLAAALATMLLNDNTTLDKALTNLLHPQEDNRKSDF